MWKSERMKLPYPSVLGGYRSNPVPTPEDVQISIQTTCKAFWLLSLYLLSKRQREGLIRTRIDFQRVQELVDVLLKDPVSRAGFSKHFFTRCVVTCPQAIRTLASTPHPIRPLASTPCASFQMHTQIRKINCRQKHAYTILRKAFWSHSYLIIFVTCNAFYIRNERTDMDSRVELVESLHPITASLRSWPIWVYFSAHGRQKNAKKACNATCCAGTVLEAGTFQKWIISRLAMRDLLSAWACSGRSCVFSWKALQREPQRLLQGEPDWIVNSCERNFVCLMKWLTLCIKYFDIDFMNSVYYHNIYIYIYIWL